MLIEHRKQGGSFESFSAKIGTHRETLYAWAQVHEDFSDAKKTALEASLEFYEALSLRGMSGQLKRVATEEAVLDAEGNPVLDSKGQPKMKRTYAPAQFSAAAWIFTMKNVHQWKDRIDVRTGELPAEDPTGKSVDEIKAESARLLLELQSIKKKCRS